MKNILDLHDEKYTRKYVTSYLIWESSNDITTYELRDLHFK